MDISILSDKDIVWINKYHQDILEKVGPLMLTDRGRKWLEESTSPIVRPGEILNNSVVNIRRYIVF